MELRVICMWSPREQQSNFLRTPLVRNNTVLHSKQPEKQRTLRKHCGSGVHLRCRSIFLLIDCCVTDRVAAWKRAWTIKKRARRGISNAFDDIVTHVSQARPNAKGFAARESRHALSQNNVHPSCATFSLHYSRRKLYNQVMKSVRHQSMHILFKDKRQVSRLTE